MTVLQVEDLSVRFGGLQAVNRFSLDVRKDEIHGLIGPNGAGKTTVFNVISRFYQAQEGTVRFLGHDLLGCKPHNIPELGVARTFQNIELFKNMTVLDNVMAGKHSHLRCGLIASGLFLKRAREEEASARDEAMSLLRFLKLEDVWAQEAGNLPFGQQRVLELARALSLGPKLLLLDEPAAGMNTRETEDLNQLLLRIRQELGIPILLVEHDMRVIMGICDRVTVMHYGQKIAEGRPEEVRENAQVIAAYLGAKPAHAPN